MARNSGRQTPESKPPSTMAALLDSGAIVTSKSVGGNAGDVAAISQPAASDSSPGADSGGSSVETIPDTILLSQGAEARVFKTRFCGRPAIVKERFRKRYRLPELDEKITAKRILQEVRCYVKCWKAGVSAPCIFLVDNAGAKIVMEYVEGVTVKQWLRENAEADRSSALRVAGKIGAAVARMHDAQIVHGDLTTSNFLLRPGSYTPVVIDFGLGFTQPLPEDKAVDLYVLERAFLSTHANSQPLVDEAMRRYKATSKKSDSTLQKLADVRKRGRKRDMFG